LKVLTELEIADDALKAMAVLYAMAPRPAFFSVRLSVAYPVNKDRLFDRNRTAPTRIRRTETRLHFASHPLPHYSNIGSSTSQ